MIKKINKSEIFYESRKKVCFKELWSPLKKADWHGKIIGHMTYLKYTALYSVFFEMKEFRFLQILVQANLKEINLAFSLSRSSQVNNYFLEHQVLQLFSTVLFLTPHQWFACTLKKFTFSSSLQLQFFVTMWLEWFFLNVEQLRVWKFRDSKVENKLFNSEV